MVHSPIATERVEKNNDFAGGDGHLLRAFRAESCEPMAVALEVSVGAVGALVRVGALRAMPSYVFIAFLGDPYLSVAGAGWAAPRREPGVCAVELMKKVGITLHVESRRQRR